jgi:hypothetical protein
MCYKRRYKISGISEPLTCRLESVGQFLYLLSRRIQAWLFHVFSYIELPKKHLFV